MRLVSHLSKAIRDLGISNTQFADQAGVARSTVQKLIGEDFKEIRVDTIERIAARLGITDITQLFTLRDDTEEFLAPFRATKAVTFLFGTHDVEDQSQGRSRTTIDVWDFRAQNELLQHLRAHVPELRDEMRFFSKESFGDAQREQVLALARKQNVVVIGSPKVNPACELLLRELFPGARAGKKRGPRLRLAERPLEESILGAPEAEEGIGVLDAATGARLASVRFAGAGQTSLDAGIVLTVFRPWQTKDKVTLVLVSGVSGCGTYGAMRGLIEHPPQEADLAPGVPFERAFQTWYSKPTDSTRDDRRVERVEPR